MNIDKFKNNTIVTADKGKYLKIKGSKAKIGRPVRIIYDNSGEIPEFEEVDIPVEE